MKASRLLAAAAVAALCAPVLADTNPFEAFRGKMKEGMYEYKMEMDMGQMPNMPPGMGKQNHTFQHCVTKEDIESGLSRNPRDRMAQNKCEFRNFKMSGNTASYTMVCSGRNQMTADMVMTFTGQGYTGDMKMTMTQDGHPMNIAQHMETRYLGPCTK